MTVPRRVVTGKLGFWLAFAALAAAVSGGAY